VVVVAEAVVVAVAAEIVLEQGSDADQ